MCLLLGSVDRFGITLGRAELLWARVLWRRLQQLSLNSHLCISLLTKAHLAISLFYTKSFSSRKKRGFFLIKISSSHRAHKPDPCTVFSAHSSLKFSDQAIWIHDRQPTVLARPVQLSARTWKIHYAAPCQSTLKAKWHFEICRKTDSNKLEISSPPSSPIMSVKSFWFH